jgi:zona occludens toxin (predicted ATPase)
MADTFDPYREALVVETETVWPDDTELDPRQRLQLEAMLHASPQEAAHLEYIRMHTGFSRRIIVTDDDLARVLPPVS